MKKDLKEILKPEGTPVLVKGESQDLIQDLEKAVELAEELGLKMKLAFTELAKKLVEEGKFKVEQLLPVYATKGAACCDLVSVETHIIWPGETVSVATGIKLEIPEGYEGVIRPRSGLYFRDGILAFGGTIDADYRGEVKVALTNHGKAEKLIEPGTRIAQLKVQEALQVEFVLVDELENTERGEGGFGSTGEGVNDEDNKAQ